MRIVLTIDDSIKDPRVVASIARGVLLVLIAENRVLIRQAKAAGKPYPSVIDPKAGLVWKVEPWKGKVEEFANIRTLFDRGWGDCDDWVGAYCAQRTEASAKLIGGRWVYEKWTPKVYWRKQPKGGYLYHAQVRRPDGRVLDPSRFLGM